MCRHDGHRVSSATVLRLLRKEGLLLEATYQQERRALAARRKAAFATEPSGPNQVWQLDFSDFETTTGGTWRLAGCRGYWSKYELGWHVSPTANQHDAIAAVELALTEAARLAGRPLTDLDQRDEQGNVQPLVTIVTDNGGPFRSFRFEAFIAIHPELRHVRTRVKTPGQNGSRVRGFGSLKYEKLFLEEIPDALDLGRARRGLPGQVQHRPPARGAGLEPAQRRPPGPGRPADPQPSRDRRSASCLTRDSDVARHCWLRWWRRWSRPGVREVGGALGVKTDSAKPISTPPGPAVFDCVSPDVFSTVLKAVTGCIARHRCRVGRGSRRGQRASTVDAHVVLVLRWLRHRLDLHTLAADAQLSIATAYWYLREALDVPAAQASKLARRA
jgi:hypothetical protein